MHPVDMTNPKAITFAAMNTVCNLATHRILQQLMNASTPVVNNCYGVAKIQYAKPKGF